MSEPDDIDRWAWDKAGEIFYGRHERGFILWPFVSEINPMVFTIAKALMDAKAEQNSDLLTEADVLDLFRQRIEDAGGQSLYAKKIHLTRSYVSTVVCGFKPIGPTILRDLGLRRVVKYSKDNCKGAS